MNPPPQTASAVSGTRRLLLRLLAGVCIAYLVIVLVAWLMLQWADQWWPATILMFTPRWLFALPGMLLLPLTVLVWSRSAFLVLASGLIVVWPLMGFNVPWSRLASRDQAGTPVRVMTLNMHYSKYGPKPLDDLIASVSPDIIAVQEWMGSERAALRSTPGWYIKTTSRLFLASRYPIKKTEELGGDSTGPHGSAAHYELDMPIGTVHVFSLHTATNRDSIQDTIHESRKGPAEMRAISSLRREQCEFIAAKASECQGPLLIVGDFNTPCESTIFKDVLNNYSDAFTAAGWGWGYTFIGAKTTVRIDHILFGKGWAGKECWVGPFVGSPHRPVIADLVWSGNIRQEAR